MEPTPRVQPSNWQAQSTDTGGGTSLPAAYVDTLWGQCVFDLADAADLAKVQAGESKAIEWYNVNPAFGTNPLPIDAPRVTAWSLEYVAADVKTGAAAYLYDTCAQLDVCNYNAPAPVARAWVWHNDSQNELQVVADSMQETQVIIGYEGPPVRPNVLLRPGMLDTISDPTLKIAYVFRLRLLAIANYAQERITIPTPCSAPPFMPTGANKGTYLFSQFPPGGLPSLPGPQMVAAPRLFRAKAISDTFTSPIPYQANIFGGPWRVHAYGVADANPDTATLDLYQLSASRAPTYQEKLVIGQTAAAVSLDCKEPLDAALLTAESTGPGSVEFFADYQR